MILSIVIGEDLLTAQRNGSSNAQLPRVDLPDQKSPAEGSCYQIRSMSIREVD
jgi:hypothetical protein